MGNTSRYVLNQTAAAATRSTSAWPASRITLIYSRINGQDSIISSTSKGNPTKALAMASNRDDQVEGARDKCSVCLSFVTASLA